MTYGDLTRQALGEYLCTPAPVNHRVAGHYMRMVSPEFRGKRPDEAFRAFVANAAIPLGPPSDQSKHIIEAFADSFLGKDCPDLKNCSYMLVNLMQDMLLLDASAHPPNGGIGVGKIRNLALGLQSQLSPVMSLEEFQKRNQALPSLPSWDAKLLENMYRGVINQSIHDVSDPKHYDIKRGKWVGQGLVGDAFGGIRSLNPLGLIPGRSDNDSQALGQKNLHPNPLEKLRRLSKLPSNLACMDCPRQGPHLQVVINHNTFVCSSCAQLHGKLQHDVRSILNAEFTTEEIANIEAGGNLEGMNRYLHSWDPKRVPQPEMDDADGIEAFMAAKYVQGRWEAPREIQEKRDGFLSSVVVATFKAILGTAEGSSIAPSQIDGLSTKAAEEVNARMVASLAGISKSHTLLKFVLEILMDVLNCESVTFFCVDPVTEQMRAAGISTTSLGFQSLDYKIASGKGITGYCAKEGKAVRVPHPLTDPRFDASTDMVAGSTTTSIFCFPIKGPKGTTAGVFRMINKSDVEAFADVAFDVRDIAVMRAVAGTLVEVDGGKPDWTQEL